MSLSFLPGDPLEVLHVGCLDRRSNYSQEVQLSHFIAALVVLDEKSQVLDILELDISQIHNVSLLK